MPDATARETESPRPVRPAPGTRQELPDDECTAPHYFLDDPTATELRELCTRVRAPLAAANALDDAWAPPRSRDAFLLNAYRNAQVDLIDIDPHDFGPIGHMGYFRRTASPLWERALDWFAERHIEG
ncbi:hypothetical protein ACN28E_22990 [Archangium lansingense]|uniref:hypothetical protein n=1 Tax=Archangium lansingense TaxID=2995310 RepID=UPI003B7DCA37